MEPGIRFTSKSLNVVTPFTPLGTVWGVVGDISVTGSRKWDQEVPRRRRVPGTPTVSGTNLGAGDQGLDLPVDVYSKSGGPQRHLRLTGPPLPSPTVGPEILFTDLISRRGAREPLGQDA